jgi:signal transduction histidine kinase
MPSAAAQHGAAQARTRAFGYAAGSERAVTAAPGERQAFLERENQRIFDEAQREADSMFAQYQLSQLLASGGTPIQLGEAVTAELLRLCGAGGVALWLDQPSDASLGLVASAGDLLAQSLPARFATELEARDWCAQQPGASALTLIDDRPCGLLLLTPPEGGSLDADDLRLLQLSRHELAVAFRSAQVRTALERERGELTAIVEGATDAIVQVDVETRVVRINSAAERLLGVAASQAIGRRCEDLLGCALAGGHEGGVCPLAEVLANGEPIAYRETSLIGADQSVVRVVGGYSRTTAPAETDGGTDARATAILRDVTAARAFEALREGFAATVSHELRTPLALIKGYTDTLLHLELEPDERQSYLERIDQTTARLTRLVNEILDIAHLDADPLVMERSPTLLSAVIGRVLADLAVSGDAGRVRSAVDATLPPIDADSARIGQVLDNLISNALKYAPPSTEIVIHAAVDGEWMVVSVEDEGVGVPADDEGLVFEPFHRARNVRESSTPGTGLGLYISRRLVEAHGGRLWLQRRSDGRSGTRASFTVPLAARRSVRRDPRNNSGG